ncbi:MAG: metalloregulator ArsR/SmtB family transcription factor [Candidatus Paceibacterota bacterium]|jgi:DNA-binding transcriptional ArsR family regulator
MKEKELEKIFKALANRRRLSILSYLKKEGTATVGEIADKINLSFKATSKHIKILHNADIVDKEQEGSRVIYWLNKEQIFVVKNVLTLL